MAEKPNQPDPADAHDAAGSPADEASTAAGAADPGAAFDPDADADAAGMAEQALADTEQAAGELGKMADARNVDLPNFQQVLADVEASGLGLLNDVELHVKVELGRTRMYVEDVLKLSEGSVVELDKLAGDPVDVYVNERLVARGEVLVLNDSFCVRVSEIIGELGPDNEELIEDDAAVEETAEASDTRTDSGDPSQGAQAQATPGG